MKIQIKNRFSGDVIFENCCKNNTLKITVASALELKINLREADLRGADLRNANLREVDLRWADLRNADLSGADLRNADLRGADLREADLRNADLRNANLREADLRNADLRNANLREADLSGAVGNKKEIFSMQLEKYSITYTKDAIQIGCKRFSILEWKEFDDDAIYKMDLGALDWWKKWKDFIFKAIELTIGEIK